MLLIAFDFKHVPQADFTPESLILHMCDFDFMMLYRTFDAKHVQDVDFT